MGVAVGQTGQYRLARAVDHPPRVFPAGAQLGAGSHGGNAVPGDGYRPVFQHAPFPIQGDDRSPF